MALRLLEIAAATPQADRLRELLGEPAGWVVWSDQSENGRTVIRVLVAAEDTEAVTDRLLPVLNSYGDATAIILPVEAAVPRPPEPEPPPPAAEPTADAEPRKKRLLGGRVGRDELYHDLDDVAGATPVFIVLSFLSAVVAAMGLMRDDGAVIIGAMVIAPLLGPNMALALATTLGDAALARRAFRANLFGVFTVVATSIVLGLAVPHEMTEEIVRRTDVGVGAIGLALASGVAGVLAFTTGASSALIGVMVAVALVPPLVVVGLALGAGRWDAAGGAAILLFTNIICVNLAAVATLLIQGVRPASWWEAKRASRATIRAVVAWTILLIALVLLITLSN